MTRVSFYFNAADRADVARKLAAKAYQAGQRTLIYTADAALAQDVDAGMWTAQPLSFIPHVRCGHPLAAQTPILIGTDPEALEAHDLIINLSDEAPACFGRFDRLIEVVGRDDAADKERARGRFRFYKERGYELDTVDLEQR